MSGRESFGERTLAKSARDARGDGSVTDAEDREFREKLVEITMAKRGCDRAEAEVILARVADRLGGFTHEEVEAMHPLPAAVTREGEEA